MLSRNVKLAYYVFAGFLMKLNGSIYQKFRAPKSGSIKVHLGPGQKNYIQGWINIDANMFTAKCDLWADLRNELPFHSSTIDAFYSHHMIEHLPNLQFHFSEIYRCLKNGGVYRVAGPNGDSAISKFIQNDCDWFGDFPDKRKSIGGRFENFIFCRQEHLTILTFSYIEELMQNAGFVKIKKALPIKETYFPAIFDENILSKEWEKDFDFPHTLIIEGQKI